MTEKGMEKHLGNLIARYAGLAEVVPQIKAAYFCLEKCFSNGGKLLVAGNGGSAADAEHIVGELMKGFKLPRRLDDVLGEALIAVHPKLGALLRKNLQGALPAIALSGHPALSTAFMNDCSPELCFAQQALGYGRVGDAMLAISTSGNSRNILFATVAAKARGMQVVGLTGEKNSSLSELADICIKVPEGETYMIQELHLPIYHCLCMMLEDQFFGEEG